MPEESDPRRKSEENVTAGKKREKKEAASISICPNCGCEVQFVWVHGHYQCPVCKNIVISCCEGEA